MVNVVIVINLWLMLDNFFNKQKYYKKIAQYPGTALRNKKKR